MQSHVDFQTPLGGKHFMAHMTFKFFHSSVSFDVSGECAFHSKCSETLVALVWLFVRVYADMAHKVTWLLEFFAAVCALMPANTVHLQNKMNHGHARPHDGRLRKSDAPSLSQFSWK